MEIQRKEDEHTHKDRHTHLKCPAELGIDESLELLLRYNSCSSQQLPISSGKVLILFDAKEIRCMPIMKILIYNL